MYDGDIIVLDEKMADHMEFLLELKVNVTFYTTRENFVRYLTKLRQLVTEETSNANRLFCAENMLDMPPAENHMSSVVISEPEPAPVPEKKPKRKQRALSRPSIQYAHLHDSHLKALENNFPKGATHMFEAAKCLSAALELNHMYTREEVLTAMGPHGHTYQMWPLADKQMIVPCHSDGEKVIV